jgi:hypothetical protein
MNNLTQEQVSDLHNKSLTRSIAKLLGVNIDSETDHPMSTGDHILYYEGKTYHALDYCTSWNDLMPLVVEHALKIQTFKRRNKFLVRVILNDNTDSFTAGAKTLQRALAECLFLVLQEKANNGN